MLNARDVSWIRSEERGQDTDFEGRQEWADLGFRIQILSPGQRGLYHGERGQEDFLVVSGECVLVIEGEERHLKAWDFVHCPPWTKHTFVGAGDGPCVIVMAGSRAGGFEVVYAVNDVASKHGATVLEGDVESGRGLRPIRARGADGVPGGMAAVMTEAGVVEEGRPAPDFTLTSDSGEQVSLESLRGKPVVLYFYPRDDTPGCTKQARGIRDAWSEFERRGAVVLGVSPDSAAKHEKFRDKYELPFTLLADEDHAVAEAYGTWVQKSFAGKKYMGVERSTFVIDQEGNVAKILRRVKPETHADDVLAALS